MSYVSLLKNIPEILTQPTGIAAIASLGIHGAIALIVPLMPVDSSKSAKTDSSKAQAVGLMELSSSDQSRLPQTVNPSQVALQTPQLPLQQQAPLASFSSQPTIMPPLEPALPSQTVLPPIPQSSANYNLSYLPRRQPVQRFTRNDFRAQVSNFRAKSTFSPSASPFVNDIDEKIRETQPLNLNRLPQVQADSKVPGEPLNNPSPDAIDIGSTTPSRIAQPQPGDNAVQIAANSPSGLAAEQSLQGKDKLALASPELPKFSQSSSQEKRREQLLANLDSYNNLRKNIQQEYPNVREQAVIRETISTNKRDIEGTVLGRLVIDPDGKVLDIKFQDRSVAPELQSKTREFFSANPPKVSKQTSSYPFQLQFKKNNDRNNIPEPVKLKPLQNQDSRTVSEPQERKNQQDNSQSVVIPNPSPTAVEENQPTESTQKLIQNLRQIKEERQKSNKEK